MLLPAAWSSYLPPQNFAEPESALSSAAQNFLLQVRLKFLHTKPLPCQMQFLPLSFSLSSSASCSWSGALFLSSLRWQIQEVSWRTCLWCDTLLQPMWSFRSSSGLPPALLQLLSVSGTIQPVLAYTAVSALSAVPSLSQSFLLQWEAARSGRISPWSARRSHLPATGISYMQAPVQIPFSHTFVITSLPPPDVPSAPRFLHRTLPQVSAPHKAVPAFSRLHFCFLVPANRKWSVPG